MKTTEALPPIVTKLPCFAELPAMRQTPEALAFMFEHPPVVWMQLADLVRERGKIRGCYEMSSPTIDTNLAFKYGRSATQWLSRDPNWLAAYRINDPVYLYELTPVLVKKEGKEGEFFRHAVWRIEVVGEREQREAVARNILAQAAIAPRFERAG